MNSVLFHTDVYCPGKLNDFCKNMQKTVTNFEYSAHLLNHLNNQSDRSHQYTREQLEQKLMTLQQTQQDVFEIELVKRFLKDKSTWSVSKFCCRIPYDKSTDIVVVFRPQTVNGVNRLFVVTAWKNNKTDSHPTLNKLRYCSEKQWLNQYNR